MVLSGWLPSMLQIPADLEFSSLLPIPYTSNCMCLFNAAHGHGNKGQRPWLKSPIRLDPLGCMLTWPNQPISQSQHGSHVTAGFARGTAMLASTIPASFPPAGNTEREQNSILGIKLPQQHFSVKAPLWRQISSWLHVIVQCCDFLLCLYKGSENPKDKSQRSEKY